jgi:hypothetical protein
VEHSSEVGYFRQKGFGRSGRQIAEIAAYYEEVFSLFERGFRYVQETSIFLSSCSLRTLCDVRGYGQYRAA